MSLLQIVVLDDDVITLCAHLARRKVIHLVDRAVVAPALREGTPAFFSTVHGALETLLGQVDATLNWLEDTLPDFPDTEPHAPLTLDPPRAVEEIQPAYEATAAELESLRDQRDAAVAEIARLSRISDVLQSFETAGVTYNELAGFRHFAFVAGTLPMRYLHPLRTSLQHVPHHVEMRRLAEDVISILVLCPKDVETSLRSVLRSVYFNEIAIPEEFHGRPREALDAIELQLWHTRESLAQLNGQLRAASMVAAPRVTAWRKAVRANLKILEAMQLFGKTARTTFVSGWVPRGDVNGCVSDLTALLKDRILIEVAEPEARGGLAHELVQRRAVRVPTKFRHPLFLKAFEGVVTTYGIPAYDGIDPTFFVAITFLIMFGMMFGDVGHGAVLLLVGTWLGRMRSMPKVRPAGWLLMATGCSSIVFGVLFGSVFGFEDLIPALWVHPMTHVPTMLITALGLGVGIMTLGIVLNVIQAAARGNMRELWFGQWGLITGVFYWLALGIFYLTVVKNADIPVLIALLVLIAPILLVVVGDLFYTRLFGGGRAPEHAPGGDAGEHGIAEILFKPVEITLGLVTNTISFVRVGAFGMNHAALMMVVFMLAKMGGPFMGPNANVGTQISYVIAVITGNLFVMVLEGMVVFIQCLRLEYYEFFSKFFTGEGIRYQPLEVEE